MNKENHYKLLFHKKNFSALILLISIIMMFNANQLHAQNATLPNSVFSEPVSANRDRKFLGGTYTNLGLGGPALRFSRFNNQFAFLTGGRGAATINNRYTIGAGGYGIANSIVLPCSSADTIRYFKMGYGELALNRIIRLHAGISYRFVSGSDLTYMKVNDMNAFSCYVGLLFGK